MDSSPAADYWVESKRPYASLIFLLPLLTAYEWGARWFDADHLGAVRNGADTWMKSWLMQVGVGFPWVLPVLIVGILCGWQLVKRYPWRVSFETLVGMFSESLLGAILLLVLGQVLSLSFLHAGWMPLETVEMALPTRAATAVGFLGAGIYEEVLFRLLLLPAMFLGLRVMLIPRRTAAVIAVLSTSLIFSLAHYVTPNGGETLLSLSAFTHATQNVASTPEAWFGFGFRVLAGVVFAVMFLLRGFGITVGCHALYDLLVGVLMTSDA
ncbi:MAG: CPBP family intramembrane metalloprotease [Planctomycetaceae bacterium]|nr:CPBP family intramembrane metalloprotease [Planctomycetaceae bacterium]